MGDKKKAEESGGEAGGVAVDLGVVEDSPEALLEKLESVGEVDALVTTGGASMGEKDLLKSVLLRLGFRLDFWRARVRPGSPMSFGHLPRAENDLPVFGLPGNPASAFVTFHVFVAPYLRARLGSARPRGTTVEARTDTALASPPGLTHYFRVRFCDQTAERQSGEPDVTGPAAHAPPRSRPGGPRCTLTGPQGSGLVRSLRDADGLAILPEGVSRVEEGEPVAVLLLPGR